MLYFYGRCVQAMCSDSLELLLVAWQPLDDNKTCQDTAPLQETVPHITPHKTCFQYFMLSWL